jgi:TP901 family phage tail tape measure protein
VATGAAVRVAITGDNSSLQRALKDSQKKLGTFGAKAGKLGTIIGAGGAVGLAALAKSAVDTEAQFSRTMSTMAAVTGAPAKSIKQLDALAIQLGASTSFSANEAAGAMLELGKAGISTETIMGGAAKGTLLLAEASGADLATAATIASNAMNTFGLKGKDMGNIAAALAGGANASTASVESLGQALSQVGPGAKNAGLNLNDTVGVLSAFDSAGIKGSDAGTSLKTMLTRLVPSTQNANAEMKRLGLDFTDAHGNFKDITEIAQELKTGFKGLSAEERTAAMQTIFGSDATRAATVLMDKGGKGIKKYIKATKDSGAAQDAAKARMKGTAGALERIGGIIETVKLQFGKALAPAIMWFADALGNAVPKITKFVTSLKAGLAPAFNKVKDAAGVIMDKLKPVGDWLKEHPEVIKGAAIAMAGLAAAVVLVSLAMSGLAIVTSPITLIVVAVAALGGAFAYAYKNSAGFRELVGQVGDKLKEFGGWLKGTVLPALKTFGAYLIAKIMPVLKQFGAFFATSVVPALKQFGGYLIANVLPVLQKFGAFFLTTVLPALQQFGGYLIANIMPVLKQFGAYFMTNILPVLQKLGSFIMTSVVPALKQFGTFLITTVVPAIVKLAGMIAQNLSPILTTLVQVFNANVKPAIAKIVAMFIQLWPTIKKVAGVVAVLIGVLLVVVSAILGKVLPVILKLAGWLIEKLVGALTTVIPWVVKIIGWVIKIGIAMFNAGKKVVEFAKKIFEKIGAAVQFIKDLPGKVKDAVSGAAKWLFDAGKNIIQGLIDGITNMFGKLKKKLGKVTDLIPDWKGPPSKDKKLLHQSGQWIMEGFAQGIDDTLPLVKKTLGNVTATVAKEGQKAVLATTIAAPALVGAFSGQPVSAAATTDAANAAVAAVATAAAPIQLAPKQTPVVVHNYLDGREIGNRVQATRVTGPSRAGRRA